MGAERPGVVYVAVPVYRGTQFVADTLRSILGQTYRDLRVMISVDGNDQASADVCAPFLTDDRVRMHLHERQLGWVDNMNWLIDACDGDYFCYWQQDDHCAPEYFERLAGALAEHPAAACAYSDLRWFGRTSEKVAMPSRVGFVQQRILAQIEAFDWIPLRGLVPAQVLRRVGLIRGLHDTLTFADYLWVLRLAAAGDLVRVPEVLYFKRDHAESASKKSSSGYQVSRREAWVTLGVTIFSEVSAHFAAEDQLRLALVIADRLVTRRPGRWFHYDAAAVSPAEPALVAHEFLRSLEANHGLELPLGPGASPEGALEGLVRELLPSSTPSRRFSDPSSTTSDRRALVATARSRGLLSVDCSASGEASAVLLDGWSRPEEWGTWNDGHQAQLWLPLPADGRPWRVTLVGRPFVSGGRSGAGRLIISMDETLLFDEHIGRDGAPPTFDLTVEPHLGIGATVNLDMPDAARPAIVGADVDQRSLAFGIDRIDIARAR